MINLCIVDDHQILLQGLKIMLESEKDIHVFGTYQSGEDLFEAILDTIDVILLDINMPGLSGIEVCKKIKSKYSSIQVIALSMYNQPSYINRMIQAGASGYLLKNSGKKEIIKAISKVMAGETYFPRSIIDTLVNNLAGTKKEDVIFTPLTRREKQILELISQEMTTQEIANHLHISLNTVESHRKNLLSKFNVRNSIGLVKKAMEKGII